MPPIVNRQGWDSFVSSIDSPPETTSEKYRVYKAAKKVFGKPCPEGVQGEEFEAVKTKVLTHLETTKEELITEFIKTMKGFNINDLDIDEIRDGNLNFKEKTLRLNNSQTREALEAIAELRFLKILNLQGNFIYELPPKFTQLTKLIELILTDNRLSNLPSGFGNLTKLQELHLGGNLLTSVPEEFIRLTSLKSLNLGYNRFTEFPPILLKLTQLKELNLWYNKIATIPDEIDELKDLTVLDLNNNLLETLPTGILRLSCLQILKLSQNKLNKLPDGAPWPSTLFELHLACNMLETIPEAIGELQSLELLNLTKNAPLSALPQNLLNRSSLLTLETHETRLPSGLSFSILASSQRLRDRQARTIISKRLELWGQLAKLERDKLQALQRITFEEREKELLCEWLLRLSRCEDYRSKPTALAEKTCRVLLALNDANFKSLFFNQIEHNLEGCGDRTAMGFSEIYLSYIVRISDPNAPLRKKVKHLVGAAKALALRKALGPLVGKEEEGVEIYLYYETHLKLRLGLVTATNRMAHTDIGKRANISEEALVATVKQNYMSELIELPAFQALIETDEDYKRDFERKKAELHQEESDSQNAEDSKSLLLIANEFLARYKEMRIELARIWIQKTLTGSKST